MEEIKARIRQLEEQEEGLKAKRKDTEDFEMKNYISSLEDNIKYELNGMFYVLNKLGIKTGL